MKTVIAPGQPTTYNILQEGTILAPMMRSAQEILMNGNVSVGSRLSHI
jgi:hypothetical protein